jgi:hypothetical protein
MALTTGAGEVSACLEMTIGYGSVYRFDSGRIGISFDFTGNSQEKIWAKDPTSVTGNQVWYLEYLSFGCSSGTVNVYDGSAGAFMFGLQVPIEASASGSAEIQHDFKDDPLVCLTTDNTQSICISATNGFTHGFFKGYWGPD